MSNVNNELSKALSQAEANIDKHAKRLEQQQKNLIEQQKKTLEQQKRVFQQLNKETFNPVEAGEIITIEVSEDNLNDWILMADKSLVITRVLIGMREDPDVYKLMLQAYSYGGMLLKAVQNATQDKTLNFHSKTFDYLLEHLGLCVHMFEYYDREMRMSYLREMDDVPKFRACVAKLYQEHRSESLEHLLERVRANCEI